MCRCASGFSIQGIAAGGRIVIRVRVCVLASPVKGASLREVLYGTLLGYALKMKL